MVVASPHFLTVKVRPVGGRSAAAPSALHAAHGGGDGRFVGRADTRGHAVPRAGSARHRGCACAGCGGARRGRGGRSPEGHRRRPLPAAGFLGTDTSRLLWRPQASTRPMVACIHTIGWMPRQMRTPLGRRRVLRIGLAVSLWFCTSLSTRAEGRGAGCAGEVREDRAKITQKQRQEQRASNAVAWTRPERCTKRGTKCQRQAVCGATPPAPSPPPAQGATARSRHIAPSGRRPRRGVCRGWPGGARFLAAPPPPPPTGAPPRKQDLVAPRRSPVGGR